MTGIVGILVTLFLVALVVWFVYALLGMLHLPQPLLSMICVIVALVVVIWLLNHFGIYSIH
jgi:hypothetical protein